MTGNSCLYDVRELKGDMTITLPYTDDAHTALRHVHTIDLNGHTVTVAIPAALFDSDSFVPYVKRHSPSMVSPAKDILCFTDGTAVPGHQKFHVLTLTSNQHSTNLCALINASKRASFVDLLCTMPVVANGYRLKALVDTASNHSMVTKEFLDMHGIRFDPEPSVTLGVSRTPAPSYGKIILQMKVGRRTLPVTCTVVASLPSAAAHWHDTNDALLGLDVISATSMRLDFTPPCIRITVPSSRSGPKNTRKSWHHVIHVHQPATPVAETSEDAEIVHSRKELKALLSQAAHGKVPLFAVHVRPSSGEHSLASTKQKGYLSEQQAPAPTPQDTSAIPSCIQQVLHQHKEAGGTLAPAPPHSTAKGFEMNIELLPGARPRAARQYRLTPAEHLELEKQVQKLLDMGWVQPSISPWASSILFAPKPGGKLRLCVDYRYLNENTVKNTYPLPRIDALLDQLNGHQYFSALDLAAGYHQIRISDSSRAKTAFRTPDGLYEWTVMPFGLTNAPSVFQQAMHTVLRGLIGKICLAYLDDIIVIGKTAEEHAHNLNLVLTRLHTHNLYCNLDKCQFALNEIKYLGHIVTATTVKPDPYKVSVLRSWPLADLQASTNNIRSFLGLAGYFRRFIPLFPTLAAPLLERIKHHSSSVAAGATGKPAKRAVALRSQQGRTLLHWTAQCTKAFEEIKQALISATGLCHPDLNKPFHLYTDASDYAFGAVLMQEYTSPQAPPQPEHDALLPTLHMHASHACAPAPAVAEPTCTGMSTPSSSLLTTSGAVRDSVATPLWPVAWAGRKMNGSEVNHATFEKELGAIVFAARQWRCYLETSQPVFIHSDHNPLKYLQTQQKLNHKQARWVESLSRINWHITYVPGDRNVVADAVSRATHLTEASVTLHDGHPVSCASVVTQTTDRTYPAVSLMFLLARRPTLLAVRGNGFAPPSLGRQRTQLASPSPDTNSPDSQRPSYLTTVVDHTAPACLPLAPPQAAHGPPLDPLRLGDRPPSLAHLHPPPNLPPALQHTLDALGYGDARQPPADPRDPRRPLPPPPPPRPPPAIPGATGRALPCAATSTLPRRGANRSLPPALHHRPRLTKSLPPPTLLSSFLPPSILNSCAQTPRRCNSAQPPRRPRPQKPTLTRLDFPPLSQTARDAMAAPATARCMDSAPATSSALTMTHSANSFRLPSTLTVRVPTATRPRATDPPRWLQQWPATSPVADPHSQPHVPAPTSPLRQPTWMHPLPPRLPTPPRLPHPPPPAATSRLTHTAPSRSALCPPSTPSTAGSMPALLSAVSDTTDVPSSPAPSPAASLLQSELPEDLFALQDEISRECRRAQRADGAASDLQSQSDQFLNLDLRVDDFWSRLRAGYAHDPAFARPPTTYNFDPKLQVYFHAGKLVVPDHGLLRRQILLWHHSHPWHAHMGQSRTMSLITDSFYWPGMTVDIRKFVSQCHSCQTNKSPGALPESVLSPLPVPAACWRVISLDMITQLPETSTGHDCVVVFVDQFSKMVRLIPTASNLDGPGFARLFFNSIYVHYGLPLGICSDRGTQWNNAFFASLCEHMGVDLRLTFSYHPRANGQVERMNRVIEEAVRHFIGPAHDDWDEYLPHIEFSINSAKSDSTGCTPFQLNRITPPLSPSAMAFNLSLQQRPSASVMHRMYFHLAKQSLAEAKQSIWASNDNRAALPVFIPGDLVLLSMNKLAVHHPSLRKKFGPRWIGPCVVVDLVGHNAAQIELPSTLRALGIHDVFHFSVLKHYIESENPVVEENPVPVKSTATGADSDQSFEVEAVVDFRRSQAQVDTGVKCPHFLVKWVGYDSSHDLWLPLASLSDCLDKVAHYLFHNTAPKQRERIIELFPLEARMHLAELVGRAQRRQRRTKGPTKHDLQPTAPTRRKRARTSPRLSGLRASQRQAAVSATATCSSCNSTIYFPPHCHRAPV